MTPAGEKWVGDHMIDSGWKVASGHIEAEAEFWLRAFCAEVEQRGKYGDRPLAISASFEELKNELLGDSK